MGQVNTYKTKPGAGKQQQNCTDHTHSVKPVFMVLLQYYRVNFLTGVPSSQVHTNWGGESTAVRKCHLITKLREDRFLLYIPVRLLYWTVWGGKLHAVKRLIIDDNLFGEIGKFKKFAKISCRQVKISQSLDISVLEIAKLFFCQIVIF